MNRIVLFAAIVSVVVAYTYTPTPSAQVAGVVYYYRTPSCSGDPVTAVARYSSLVLSPYGGSSSSSCSDNAQCAGNAAAQATGFCGTQIVSLVANEFTFDVTVANANKSIAGGYNTPVTQTYEYGTCVPSRSFANCYYMAVPIAFAATSGSYGLAVGAVTVVASVLSLLM